MTFKEIQRTSSIRMFGCPRDHCKSSRPPGWRDEWIYPAPCLPSSQTFSVNGHEISQNSEAWVLGKSSCRQTSKNRPFMSEKKILYSHHDVHALSRRAGST